MVLGALGKGHSRGYRLVLYVFSSTSKPPKSTPVLKPHGFALLLGGLAKSEESLQTR